MLHDLVQAIIDALWINPSIMVKVFWPITILVTIVLTRLVIGTVNSKEGLKFTNRQEWNKNKKLQKALALSNAKATMYHNIAIGKLVLDLREYVDCATAGFGRIGFNAQNDIRYCNGKGIFRLPRKMPTFRG